MKKNEFMHDYHYDTDKKWIDFLNRQIDLELAKPENEQSMEFIDECSALIDEACGEAVSPDPKIKERRIAELYAAFEKRAAVKRRRTMSEIWRKAAVAACALIAVITMPVFVTAAVNRISPVDVLEQWGQAIFDLPYDTPVEEAGLTFTKNGDVTYYESIEKLLEAENLDIMYPDWLPEGVTLTEIIEIGGSKGKAIVFEYSGAEIYYVVNLYDDAGKTISRDFTDDIVDINGISCYITVIEGRYNALFVNGGFSYSVTAYDRDTLIKLIVGLKQR